MMVNRPKFGAAARLLAVVCGLWAAGLRADSWIELRSPHFTVISEASERRTRDWGVEFELFRRALGLVIPVDPTAVEPVTLVLFRSDRRLRQFKPMESGKPSAVAGFFAHAGGRKFIALCVEGSRDGVREIVFHEGVHWHLAAVDRPRPVWLEEGLAEVFGNFHLEGSSFVIGAFRPEFMRTVQVAKPLPFSRMREIGLAGLNYNGAHADLTVRFYQQAWLTVHALVFGTKGVGALPLAVYLRQPPQHRDPTTDFLEGLGLDSAAMDECLADYLARGRYSKQTYPFDRGAVEQEFLVRAAAAAEVDLALGSLLVGVGRAAESEDYLRRAAAGLSGDPRSYDALAHRSEALDRPADAAEEYREAIRRGSKSCFGPFFLGRQSQIAAQQSGAEATEVATAVAHFVQCLRLNPRFVPAYECLGLAVPLLARVDPEVEELLRGGATRFPANVAIQCGRTSLALRKGDWPAAQASLAWAESGVEGTAGPLSVLVAALRQEWQVRSAPSGTATER